jgi:hypothetical protein
MALTDRQLMLYTYTASLYRPNALAAGSDIEATEGLTNPTPAFTGVPCYYGGTPEVDLATVMGLGKEANLFTFDSFRFDAHQEIADAWVIEMTSADPDPDTGEPHPLIGRFWVVRDNPQTVGSQGNRRANYQMVFAVLSNLPGLSGLVSNVA